MNERVFVKFGIVLPQKVTSLRQSVGKHLDELPRHVTLYQ